MWLIKCVNTLQIFLYTLCGYMLSYNLVAAEEADIHSSSFNVSYINYLNFILALIKSLCGYSCIADKHDLNIKCQHVLPLVLTAITFSIYPATSWLTARYGYHDAQINICKVLPIVIHNFCIAIQYLGKNVLQMGMKR